MESVMFQFRNEEIHKSADLMKSRLELLGEAEQDVRSGNITHMEDTINELHRELISGNLV